MLGKAEVSAMRVLCIGLAAMGFVTLLTSPPDLAADVFGGCLMVLFAIAASSVEADEPESDWMPRSDPPATS